MLASLKGWTKDNVKSIRSLGSDEQINYTVNQFELVLDMPKHIEEALAYTFQVACKDLNKIPFQVVNLESVKKIKEEAAKKYGATGNDGNIPLP